MQVAPLPVADEAARLAALRRMKLAATGLLLAALVVFVVARLLEPTYPWLGFVRATAEASLVGGLADWFAVTALFRRPLGLPIPHTAIIQTQKDRIGRILGTFFQRHFLARPVLAAKLATMRPAERLGRWLSEPGNDRQLARQIATGVARTVEMLPEAEVKDLVQRSAVGRLESLQLAPLLGDVLTVVASGNRHQDLLDAAMGTVGEAVQDSRDTIRARVRGESPRWVPAPVTDAVADRIIGGIRRFLSEVAADPQHPMRQRFDGALRDFTERLRHSPELIAKAEALKQELLGHPMVEGLASSLWERARRAAERYQANPESSSLEPLEAALAGVGESLLTSDVLRADVDEFLVDVVSSLVEQHRQEVADLIATTVRDWDPEMAAQRIELAVGRDLQFIRLNGTLVGGLAGLIIYTLSRFM